MSEKLNLMAEAYRRGILPDDKKPLFEEAMRRGLVPSMQPQKKQTPLKQAQSSDFSNEPKPEGAFPMTRQVLGDLKDFTVGAGQGLREIGQGVGQLGLKAGNYAGVVADETTSDYGQDVEAQRAEYESSPAGRSTAGEVGEFVGGTLPFFAVPGGAVGGLARRAAVGSAQGAVIGGAQYVPEGGSRAANAARGFVFGGGFPLAGKVAGVLPSGIKKVFRGSGDDVASALDDAGKAGIDLSAGQASGTWRTQGVENVLGGTPGSASKMATFGQRQQEHLGKRIGEISESIAPKAEASTAGAAIKSGIQGFSESFKKRAGKLYDVLDKHIPADKTIGSGNTIKALQDITGGADDIAASLRSPGLKPIMERLQAKAGDAGHIPYAELKGLRSIIGKKLGEPRLSDDIGRGDLKRVYSALSNDLKQAAQEAGPDAVRAYTRAGRYYKAGSKRIDTFLKNINKKTSPESVYKAATASTREGATQLRAIKRSLKPDEWNVVSAATLKRMGQSTPGQQNAAGEAFSSNTFLTNWNRLSKPARREMFSGSSELRRYAKDIDAIARTTDRIKGGAAALSNPSGSGARVTWAMGVFMAPGALVGGTAASNASARLLTNPKFVRWLASAPKGSSKRVISHHLAKLSTIAATSDEESAEDMRAYQQTVMDTVIPPAGASEKAPRVGGSAGVEPLVPGNIDLANRPVVKNADGSISTVRSMSANFDGKEVLIPTVAADGSRILSEAEAVAQYRKTGQHLGMFATPEEASAYAEVLHKQQAKMYGQPRVSVGMPRMVKPSASQLRP